jgi:insulin receptor
LTRLKPNTQYAYYIRAYTLSTSRNGAQSDVHYFKTLPGTPGIIKNPTAVVESHSKIVKITVNLVLSSINTNFE